MLIQRLILSRRAKKWRKASGAEVPTICVGNITVGGTGKTPHTEMILDMLQRNWKWGNSNLAVLSRGYKRKSKGFQQVVRTSVAEFAGDEPLQIKKKFPAVTVAVDKDRIEGCDFLVHPEKLQEKSKATKRVKDPLFPASELIVLDDAFQYHKLHADLNIVLMDYHRPITSDKLLPAGRLRDLKSRLKDADILIVTKAPSDMTAEERAAYIKENKIESAKSIYFTTIKYEQPVAVFEQADPRYSYAQNLVLFTGIANDEPLRAYLSDHYKIVEHLTFPDHHAYSKADLHKVADTIKRYPTAVLMTTEKDAQRVLDSRSLPEIIKQRLFYVPIKVDFLTEEDRAAFEQAITL